MSRISPTLLQEGRMKYAVNIDDLGDFIIKGKKYDGRLLIEAIHDLILKQQEKEDKIKQDWINILKNEENSKPTD